MVKLVKCEVKCPQEETTSSWCCSSSSVIYPFRTRAPDSDGIGNYKNTLAVWYCKDQAEYVSAFAKLQIWKSYPHIKTNQDTLNVIKWHINLDNSTGKEHSTFFGNSMDRRNLKYLETTGKLKGERGRIIPREITLDSLVSWHKGHLYHKYLAVHEIKVQNPIAQQSQFTWSTTRLHRKMSNEKAARGKNLLPARKKHAFNKLEADNSADERALSNKPSDDAEEASGGAAA